MKKDQSIKLALDSKVLNKAIHKNKYQMPNIEMLIDTISQHLTDTQNGQQAYFTTLDLKYAYSQLNCIKTQQNTVILISYVANLPVHIDSKLVFMVLQICRQNSKKLWITHS